MSYSRDRSESERSSAEGDSEESKGSMGPSYEVNTSRIDDTHEELQKPSKFISSIFQRSYHSEI
jgi:hypothetical protein